MGEPKLKPDRLDARAHRRVPAVVRVCVGQDFHDTYDLSCGGFALATPRPLAPGTRARFVLGLEWDVDVELVGEVAWGRRGAERPGMGVRIVDASESGREWLASYVEKLIKDADRL